MLIICAVHKHHILPIWYTKWIIETLVTVLFYPEGGRQKHTVILSIVFFMMKKRYVLKLYLVLYPESNVCTYTYCAILLCSPKNFGGAYSRRLVRPSVSPSVRQSVRPSVRPIRVRPITSLFEVGFRNNFTEMTTMLRRRVARKIWVPTLKVKVTVRPCSKFVSGP